MERRSVYDVQEALDVAENAEVRPLILSPLSHEIDEAESRLRLPTWASLAWDGRVVAS